MRNKLRFCKECDNQISKEKRSDSVFCSPKCRLLYWIRKHPRIGRKK